MVAVDTLFIIHPVFAQGKLMAIHSVEFSPFPGKYTWKNSCIHRPLNYIRLNHTSHTNEILSILYCGHLATTHSNMFNTTVKQANVLLIALRIVLLLLLLLLQQQQQQQQLLLLLLLLLLPRPIPLPQPPPLQLLLLLLILLPTAADATTMTADATTTTTTTTTITTTTTTTTTKEPSETLGPRWVHLAIRRLAPVSSPGKFGCHVPVFLPVNMCSPSTGKFIAMYLLGHVQQYVTCFTHITALSIKYVQDVMSSQSCAQS